MPRLTRADALHRLRDITRGIDADECSDDDGWWATTTGAEFGSRKLAELTALIVDLTPSEDDGAGAVEGELRE